MENSKDETMPVLVLRGLIVGAILILVFAVSSRCYKAVRRALKASEKTSLRPVKKSGHRANKASIKYPEERASASRPPKMSDGLIDQAYAVEEFVMGGQNDSDSD